MNLGEFTKYDGLGLAELVKNKDVLPAELLEMAIKAVEKLNPKLNAVVKIFEENALEEIKQGLPSGAFEGVPFLFKELAIHAKKCTTKYGE